jgi:1-acyl-sn-glycerol-3-phosphate acyltransferase
MISIIVGAIRFVIVLTIVVLGTATVWLTSFVPMRIRGPQLCAWITLGMGRSILWTLNIDVICEERERYAQHQGFIFPNHKSYVDALVVMSIYPVRFVADSRIHEAPFTGRIGDAIDVVWVDLFNKEERARKRDEIADVAPFPPIVLFPEGKIHRGIELYPLRHGAFDIAIRAQLPVMPAMIIYEQHDVIYWSIKDGSIMAAIWRNCRYLRRKTCHVELLPTFVPQADADPVALAAEVHTTMSNAMRDRYEELDIEAS